MSYLLDGAGRAELRRILLDAFDRDQLDRALREASPARELDHLVAHDSFNDQVGELIEKAERAGWLDQFTRILEDELPRREDLHTRLKTVLVAAEKRATEVVGGDDSMPPAVALRGRLLAFSGTGAALGLAGGLAGIVTWFGDTQAAPWSLVIGGVCLLGAVVFGALLATTLIKDRLGDGALSFVRSRLPLAALVALAGLGAVNVYLATTSGAGSRPNFILQVIDGADGDSTAVANQPVHLEELVNPGEETVQIERITSVDGQAFFNVRLGSGFLYSGGIRITEGQRLRNCSFPAFPATEAQLVVQNVAALNCLDGPVGGRTIRAADSQMRVASEFASSEPLPAAARERIPIDSQLRKQRAPLGTPAAPLHIDRSFYSLGYDPSRRVPLWATFVLARETPGRTPGASPRDEFVPDPDLPEKFQSRTSDYEENPYLRGLLVPAVVAGSGGPIADAEAFYYTATVPQAGIVDRTGWSRVTRFVRDLAARAGPLHVTTGPVYNNRLVMGPGRTLIPVALYQVLLRRDRSGQWRAIGFAVANNGNLDKNFDPRKASVSVAEIEERTGLKFFPDLPPDRAERVKSNSDINAFLPEG